MEIGFIGLGNMGEPMATNLLAAGYALRVFNRTRGRADALVALGAMRVDTPAAACASGMVATMLSNDQAVEEIVFGINGILQGLPAGGVHISHSTISPGLSRRLAEAHRQKGQSFVAAPVLGRPEAAQAARLVVVAAGPPEAVVGLFIRLFCPRAQPQKERNSLHNYAAAELLRLRNEAKIRLG